MDETVQPKMVLEENLYRPEEISPKAELATLSTPYRDVTTSSKHFREELKEDKSKENNQDDDLVFGGHQSVKINQDLGALTVMLEVSQSKNNRIVDSMAEVYN